MSTLKERILSSPPARWLGLSKQPPGIIQPPPQPDAKKRASQSIRTLPRTNVSYQIQDVKTAIDMALNTLMPIRKKLTLIYYYIMQDSHLSSQIQIAIQKVLAEPFSLYDKNGNKLEEDSRIIQSSWFEQLMTNILEEEFWGFRLVELVVNPDKTVDLEVIPNENVCPEWEIIWLTEPFQNPNIIYAGLTDEFNLMFFGRPNNFGVLQKAAYNVIWKYYARNDWSRASEKFGMPILLIEADTNNDEELDRLEAKAANFGSDGYFVAQSGDKPQIIERKGQDMHKIYMENINYCDEQISKLINGQTGSSDEKSFTGAAQVHERLMEDITFWRMRKLRSAVNDIVIPYLQKRGLLSTNVSMFDFDRFHAADPNEPEGQTEVDDPNEPTEPEEPTTVPPVKPVKKAAAVKKSIPPKKAKPAK